MDPQDRLRSLLDGMACTVCEERVAGHRIRLLARREDLAFVEIDCPSCDNSTLGFIVAEDPLPLERAGRSADPRPLSADDVLDMHLLLESWRGDLRSLLDAAPARDAGPPR